MQHHPTLLKATCWQMLDSVESTSVQTKPTPCEMLDHVIAELWKRDILISFKNMAVSQLWKKRKFVATVVLIELMDEDEELRWKRSKTRGWIRRRDEKGFFNNLVHKLMWENTVAYCEMIGWVTMRYADRLSTNECSHMGMLEEKCGRCWTKSLTEIKLHSTSLDTIKHCQTWPNMVFKWRQHVVPNYVRWCCPKMLHLFKRAFTSVI